jgi:hypothetical protein
MQHAHVKCKESSVNRYILEEFHNDPALVRRLMGQAHLERSRAIGAGFAWLFRQVKALLVRRGGNRPARWIERLG